MTATAQAGAPETLAERYARLADEDLGHGDRVDRELRRLDLVLGAGALVAFLPLMGLIAVAVLVSSGRPVLYRGARVGRSGRIFTMLKFRTLNADAEQRLGRYMGRQLDDLTPTEMTPIGRVLRASQLDELPQLVNVVRGEMSIVGPRPIRPVFFAQLCEEIPQYWQRLVVPPGMTGFAQLRIRRDMSWAEKLAHDLEYIADRSPGLYLQIASVTAGRLAGRIAVAPLALLRRAR
jgi:lipopolysaccharide/colanic/teichoic acid biosynthesis glycosyltransferase